MTRFLMCMMAAIYMMVGLTGFYMFIMWSYSWIDPLIQYPLRHAVDRNGVILSIIMMIIGVAAYLLYLSFLRHARGTVNKENPSSIDRLTKTLKDSW